MQKDPRNSISGKQYKKREKTQKPLTDPNYNEPHNTEGRVSFLVESWMVFWIWYKTLGKSISKI